MFQIKSDTNGFRLKLVGTMPSEKILEIYFSGSGNILCTIETDSTKNYVTFYMIQKTVIEQAGSVNQKGAKDSQMTTKEEIYEFKKMGRSEIKDRNWVAKWD